MTRPWLPLPAFLLLALLPGCLELECGARISKQGSGTFEEAVTVDIAKLDEARRIFAERMKDKGQDPTALPLDAFGVFDPKQRLRELRATEGLSDVSQVRIRSDGGAREGTRRHVLRARFASLQVLFESGLIDDMVASLAVTREGKAWQLVARSVFDDPEHDEAVRTKHRALRRTLLKPFAGPLEGLRIVRRLTFPTEVLASNGSLSADKRTVTWTLGAADIADPARLRQEVEFAAAPDLVLETFGDAPAPAPSKPAPAKKAPAGKNTGEAEEEKAGHKQGDAPARPGG